MRVVSNTSPLSNLAVVGRLDLLRQRYGSVTIPLVVAQELGRLSHPDGQAALVAAILAGWLKPDPTVPPLLSSSVTLDPGETAAIALALAVHADVLFIDEKRGRAAARSAGLTVSGLLGELLHAKFVGRIPSMRAEIQRLRSQAGE